MTDASDPQKIGDALRAISEEVDRLHAAGALTEAAFARLVKDAARVVGEHTFLLEGLFMKGVLFGLVTPANT